MKEVIRCEYILTSSVNVTLIMGNSFYVGNTDGIMQFPYQPGQTQIAAKGRKILELPAGGYNNHWTRNLLASKDGRIFL